ncbi:MAG: hypothetical protein ACREXW_20825 [Gammaproteobacteria bacterium]
MTSPSKFALGRYNTDGSLDAGFGSGGLVLTDFGIGQSSSRASALVLQPDGKLVAAGEQFVIGSSCQLALARYNTDGSLDTSFGSDGRVSESERNESRAGAQALVLQPDGKVVTAGSAEFVFVDGSGLFGIFELFRLETDGSLDTSFGIGGSVISIFGSDPVIAEALVLQSDSKLVVAGGTRECFSDPFTECPTSDFVLVRHNPDGSLDTSFGSGGRVLTNFSGRFDFFTNRAQALVQQPDGKLVAAGISRASGDTDFALARYLVTDERPAPPPRCGGFRATMLGTPGNDTLRGTFFGRDVILGLGGNDTIRGLGGDDILCGGPGNDVLIGGDDTDRLNGGKGHDKLFGDRGLSAVDGDDSLYGGPGRDTLVADGGADLLFGEGHNDRLLGDAGQDTLDGGDGRDRCRDRLGGNTFASCENGRVPRPPEPARDPPPSNPSACSPSSSSPCTAN